VIALLTQPLISIILTTYNRSHSVVAALLSVLNQTYKNFEVIIVDDGSTDGTQELIKPFLTDLRIKYHFTNNQGQTNATNNGLKIASGDWFAFLDSDDEYYSNHIELLVKKMIENTHVDLVISTFELITHIKNPVVVDFYNPTQRISLSEIKCCLGCMFVSKNAIFKLNGFSEKLLDIDFFNRFTHAGFKYIRQETPTYKYYFGRFDDSVSLDLIK
jgi:glycosyltransferase involved in cell wall biosynthesis